VQGGGYHFPRKMKRIEEKMEGMVVDDQRLVKVGRREEGAYNKSPS